MKQYSKRGTDASKASLRSQNDRDYLKPTTAVEAIRAKAAYPGMKLIPWSDIWASLKVARVRGNGEMIEVFYDTLFKEAVFDDRGAWSLEIRKPN